MESGNAVFTTAPCPALLDSGKPNRRATTVDEGRGETVASPSPVETLQHFLFASLIPSAGLLGFVFAFLYRKRMVSVRETLLWLALLLGSLVAGGWLIGRALHRSESAELAALAFASAFAFVYPPATSCWLRLAQRAKTGGVAFSMTLGSCFLFFVGLFWGGLMAGFLAAFVWSLVR